MECGYIRRSSWGSRASEYIPKGFKMNNTRKRRATRDPLRRVKPRIVDTPTVEQRNLIKGKIGIIDRKMIHEKILARQIDGDLIPNRINVLKRYDKIILLAPHRIKELANVRKVKLMYPGVKIILWWIGSDVLSLRVNSKCIPLFKKFKVKHVTVSEGIHDELLGKYKLNSQVIPLVPDDDIINEEFPKKYTVASYIPHHKSDFYNYKFFIEVAKRCPNTKFIIYGNKKPFNYKLKNVEDRGWVNGTRGIVKDSNCLLRITNHDGFPKSIIEFMRAGRFVITNHEYPYVFRSRKIDEVVDTIKKKPTLPKEGREYYVNDLSVANFKKMLSEVL